MDKKLKVDNIEFIVETLRNVDYGTLALSDNSNQPYSVPVNFVLIHKEIYFHGGKRGRKMSILKTNPKASFSIVEPYSIIPSYFSSKDELACPVSHFFKSVIIDGKLEFVTDYNEKILALSGLMEKLQPEGKYKSMSQEVYNKAINATTIYKLIPTDIGVKFNFGQYMSKERIMMVIEHLEKRSEKKDVETVELIKQYNSL